MAGSYLIKLQLVYKQKNNNKIILITTKIRNFLRKEIFFGCKTNILTFESIQNTFYIIILITFEYII